jgi:EAL domain-containing protein (putative c-di-GMP-specific phosphodiesterase class I)
MVQPAYSDRAFLGEGVQDIVDNSLNWLRPAYAHMLEAIRQVGQDEADTASPESALLNPANLMVAIYKKTVDYLTGQNAAVRLALIDQNDYDILVEELAAYRDEIDQQDTALSFIEKHLGRLLNRRIVRDSNPYSLRNLSHFTLEALADQGMGHGVRRALLRDFLDHAVPEMQSNLWDLANELEPLAKQISNQNPTEAYPTFTAPRPSGVGQLQPSYGQFGLPDFQTNSAPPPEAKAQEANQLERLLNALDSFERYKSSHNQFTRQVTPSVLAQWASQTAADATVMKGVIASSMLADVPGFEPEANMPLDSLTAVLMEQVARNNEALIQNPDHPVRQLLNRLFATLASGPTTDEMPKLKEWVESAGRVLLHKPQEAPALLGELERLGASTLLRRRDRLLERQLELESWHRMLRAKQRSKESLDKSLAGRNVHRKAAAFAQQYWSHVLTMIALRHNPGTQIWNDAQDAATVLGQSPLSREQLEKLDAIAKRELAAYFSTEDAGQALEGWLQQLEEPSSGVNIQIWKGLTGVEGLPVVPAEGVPKPVLGSWVRFADKPWPYPLQLIWNSLPFGYLGFTDAAAERSFRIEVGEWAKHVSAGRLEDYGVTSFAELPPLLDQSLESWTYENQLLGTLRDGATGLLNRRGLIQALDENDMDETEQSWQVLVIEIPRLADHYLQEGMQEGDKALGALVGLLRGQDYNGLTLARLTETRFAAAAPLAETSLVDVFKPLFEKQYQTSQAGWYFHLGYCPKAPPGEALIKAAEEAVEDARQIGQYSLQIKAIEESQLESWMRATTRIIREGRLELHAQPMQALKDGLNSHAEILLRLKSDDNRYHSPALFLREAERQKLMPQVDLWVLRSLGEWLEGRTELPQQVSGGISINLSGQTLSDPVSQEAISDWIRQSAVNPAWLIFEITETSAVANLNQVGQFLRELREMGCRTALDDFGSGYANYTYLRELPFDYLKIDGSFVRNLIENETDRALVGSMAEVARRFGLKSIAEFVHDLDLVPILKELGVDYGQGYALGMPVPLAQLGN